MAHAQALNVHRITAEDAAVRLAGVEALDPSGGAASALELARYGQAFAVEGQGGSAVYVLAERNGVVFVVAAQGRGDIDMTHALDHVITEQAREHKAVACQTARPGLVRKLQKRGWRITGWVLRKDISA